MARRSSTAVSMIFGLATAAPRPMFTTIFSSRGTCIAAGDYIIRGDQPYHTLLDMYFGVQNYPVANPRPYDDTGWTMQYMRNVKLHKAADKSIFDKPMTLLASD